MPPPNYAYQDLVSRYKSLVGVDDLSTEDGLALREFVNGRARIAHERYPFPEFTIYGEAINLGTSNSICLQNVSGTQSADRTLFKPADIVYRIHKSDPRFHSIDDFGEEYLYFLENNSLGDQLAKIQKKLNEDSGTIYVTYRKDLRFHILEKSGTTTGKYGSESGDNGDLPYSISDYLIYGSYVDFLKSDGQASKAMQEEINAEKALQQAIDKVQNQSRGFRSDIIEYRPASQFRRHNQSIGGQPVNAGQPLANNIQ